MTGSRGGCFRGTIFDIGSYWGDFVGREILERERINAIGIERQEMMTHLIQDEVSVQKFLPGFRRTMFDTPVQDVPRLCPELKGTAKAIIATKLFSSTDIERKDFVPMLKGMAFLAEPKAPILISVITSDEMQHLPNEREIKAAGLRIVNRNYTQLTSMLHLEKT